MTTTQKRTETRYGDPEIAYPNEILRTVVGSGVHGIAIEGTDDHDEMGIFIEPASIVVGLDRSLDHYVWRTQPEGARSGPGDTDLIIYSLRKWLRLAIKGNPTVLIPLWCPASDVININDHGAQLRLMRDAFMSQEAAQRVLGYMDQQRRGMLGIGGAKIPSRPELVKKYGFDTKYASHALRLALQGLEIVEDGRLTLPMLEVDREMVLRVKQGLVPQAQIVAGIEGYEEATRDLLDRGDTRYRRSRITSASRPGRSRHIESGGIGPRSKSFSSPSTPVFFWHYDKFGTASACDAVPSLLCIRFLDRAARTLGCHHFFFFLAVAH